MGYVLPPWMYVPALFSHRIFSIGELVSLSMPGQQLLIINSYKVAMELLDKRGSLYSDRPQPPSAQLAGYTNMMPLLAYGDRFREQRRTVNHLIGSRASVDNFAPLQEASTSTFLLWLLESPAEFEPHIRRCVLLHRQLRCHVSQGFTDLLVLLSLRSRAATLWAKTPLEIRSFCRWKSQRATFRSQLCPAPSSLILFPSVRAPSLMYLVERGLMPCQYAMSRGGSPEVDGARHWGNIKKA